MMEKFRQITSNFFWMISASYILVLFLQAVGLWNLTMTLVQMLVQLVYGFLVAMVVEVWIKRVPIQKRWIKVSVVYACIGLFVLLLLWFCIPKMVLWYQALSLQFPKWMVVVKQWVPNTLWNQSVNWVPTVSTFVVHQTQGFMQSIQKVGIVLMSAIFISLDLPYLAKWLQTWITLDTNFIKTADSIIFQYMKGLGLDILFLYLSFCFLLTIFQFPESYLFAGVLAILNLFPIIGPMIGWLLLLVLCYFHFTTFPFALVLSVLLFQQVESNWIQPLIFKKVMHLRPIVTLISLFVCGNVFGIFGMLFSPIIAGIVQLVFRSFVFSKRTKTVGSWEDVWYNFQD